MSSRSLPLLAAAAALVLTGLAGCGQPAAPNQSSQPSSGGAPAGGTGKVEIVASTDVYGSIASAVGGDHAHVTSIIHSADADPHEYESTPADALAVSKAKVMIANGGGYDDFASKLVSASGGQPAVIDVSQLSGLDTGANSGDEFNEHVFYHLPTMAKLADTVAADLGKADPANAASYTSNAAKLKTQLDGLTAKVNTIKSGHNGDRIAVTEPVPLYLTAQAGLVNATPEEFSHAIEDGNDPPAAVLQQTLALFQGPGKVRTLLLNAQTESPVTTQVEQAAAAGGVPVVKVTETLPADKMDYVTWMDGQIDQLAAALGNQP